MTRRAARRRRQLGGFNGAAASWPRMTRVTLDVVLQVIMLQWGRGQLAADDRRLFTAARRGPRGFNGAAASWPRMTTRVAISPERQARLQWGRGQLAADDWAEQVCPHPDGELQWGRGQLA